MHFTHSLPQPGRTVPLTASFCTLITLASAFGDSITLTPSADAELRQASPSTSFGSGPTMVSGGLGSNAGNTRRRAVLRFELAEVIPPGALITAAELTIHAVSMLPPNPVSSNFELRRLLRPWQESAVTWNSAEAPAVPWSAGGAAGEDDTATTASASVRVMGLGPYIFATTPELIADVNHWLADPTSNAGWLLRSVTELPFTARHFGTRENAASPARLTLTFTVPTSPEPVTITDVGVENGEIIFSFQGMPAVAYHVEFRAEAPGNAWQTITSFPSSASATVNTVRHAIQGAAGFYRVESTAASE